MHVGSVCTIFFTKKTQTGTSLPPLPLICHPGWSTTRQPAHIVLFTQPDKNKIKYNNWNVLSEGKQICSHVFETKTHQKIPRLSYFLFGARLHPCLPTITILRRRRRPLVCTTVWEAPPTRALLGLGRIFKVFLPVTTQDNGAITHLHLSTIYDLDSQGGHPHRSERMPIQEQSPLFWIFDGAATARFGRLRPGFGIVAELYRWDPGGGLYRFAPAVILPSGHYFWAKMPFFGKKRQKK